MTDAAATAAGVPPLRAEARRVWINGRFLTQAVTGVQRSARELVRALDRLLEDPELRARYRIGLLVPRGPSADPGLRRIGIQRVGRLRGHAWEQVELPWYSRGDLLLSLCNVAPVVKRPQIVVVHDAAVFAARGGYSIAFAAWYRSVIRALRRTASLVLTPSEFSSNELCRTAGFSRDDMRVIRWGAEHIGDLEGDGSVLERHGLRERGFLLAVGSLNPNKNFATLVRALADASGEPPVLVLAGGFNARVHADDAWGRTLAGAVHVGYVDDRELKALYQAASAFVFPSLYEGFGLPPLEAMACGCPVVAADIPAVREVCGEVASYFDPRDERSLREAVARVLSDPRRADVLRREGLRRAGRFTWEAAARGVLAAIDEVVPA